MQRIEHVKAGALRHIRRAHQLLDQLQAGEMLCTLGSCATWADDLTNIYDEIIKLGDREFFAVQIEVLNHTVNQHQARPNLRTHQKGFGR